jgi:beta-phosphoglucomutase
MNKKAFIFDLDRMTPPDIISWREKIANELHIDFTLEHNELLKA